MKYLLLTAMLLLFTACGINEQTCIDNGHTYVTTNLVGHPLQCADVDRNLRIVDTYSTDNTHTGTVSLEEYFGLRKAHP